jgi:prepilin-type N-terminal cleavage/methylation domain-containing protein
MRLAAGVHVGRLRAGARACVRAFTLIEVMVVLALVSVLVMLAGPDLLRMWRTANEPADAIALEVFLAHARGTARRLNRCVLVSRSSDRDLSWTTFADGSAQCPPNTETPVTKSFKTHDTLRVDPFVGTTNSAELLFLRTGGTPYDNEAVVQVTSTQTSSMRLLAIAPATGALTEIIP